MLAKQVKDLFVILRSRLPLSQRLHLLTGLFSTFRGGTRLLGWEVEHFSRSSLILLYSEIFARQCYRFKSIRPDPVIFDCGANIGMATLYFKWLYPQARITAFEPSPATFTALMRNIKSNSLNHVAAHNVALSSADGEIPFSAPEPGSPLGTACGGCRTINVASRKLSSFISGPVDLLKLDIEGMEGEVLQDLADAGKLSLIRETIIEVHHNSPVTLGEILHLLDVAGFHYHIVDAYARVSDCSTLQTLVIHAVNRV